MLAWDEKSLQDDVLGVRIVQYFINNCEENEIFSAK